MPFGFYPEYSRYGNSLPNLLQKQLRIKISKSPQPINLHSNSNARALKSEYQDNRFHNFSSPTKVYLQQLLSIYYIPEKTEISG